MRKFIKNKTFSSPKIEGFRWKVHCIVDFILNTTKQKCSSPKGNKSNKHKSQYLTTNINKSTDLHNLHTSKERLVVKTMQGNISYISKKIVQLN